MHTNIMPRKKVVYIQHASVLGGSCVSLLYTALALDPELYAPHIVLAQPTPEVERLYVDAGLPTTRWAGIGTWNHASGLRRPMYSPLTWANLSQVARRWRTSERRTLEMVEHLKPDLVHLNASVLLPSARALSRAGVPCIWHVREHPPADSWRTALFRRIMLRAPHELIFLSQADRQAWVQGQRGEVVYNFVDFARYNRHLGKRAARQRFGIPQDVPVVLYVGGLNTIKGIFVLQAAMRQVRRRVPGALCLAPNTQGVIPRSWLLRAARTALPWVGSGTTVQRAEKAFATDNLGDCFVRMPFCRDMPELLAAADVLVFPATVPHFARPVVEAAAMGKPSIVADLPGARELVVHEQTGLLTAPHRPGALADALVDLLTHPARAQEMGRKAHLRATDLFSATVGSAKIMQVYARRLAQTS